MERNRTIGIWAELTFGMLTPLVSVFLLLASKNPAIKAIVDDIQRMTNNDDFSQIHDLTFVVFAPNVLACSLIAYCISDLATVRNTRRKIYVIGVLTGLLFFIFLSVIAKFG